MNNLPPAPIYIDEMFSPTDMDNADAMHANPYQFPNFLGSFLATPGGRIEFYNPANQGIYFLQGSTYPDLLPDIGGYYFLLKLLGGH
jgi:hypothetical protein